MVVKTGAGAASPPWGVPVTVAGGGTPRECRRPRHYRNVVAALHGLSSCPRDVIVLGALHAPPHGVAATRGASPLGHDGEGMDARPGPIRTLQLFHPVASHLLPDTPYRASVEPLGVAVVEGSGTLMPARSEAVVPLGPDTVVTPASTLAPVAVLLLPDHGLPYLVARGPGGAPGVGTAPRRALGEFGGGGGAASARHGAQCGVVDELTLGTSGGGRHYGSLLSPCPSSGLGEGVVVHLVIDDSSLGSSGVAVLAVRRPLCELFLLTPFLDGVRSLSTAQSRRVQVLPPRLGTLGVLLGPSVPLSISGSTIVAPGVVRR
mmetsp:Transcript_21092/g.61311  ORF Transcript_21092/g.61311 Transcript_21092/m.61311 type:complete len:319 (-) Transcript_21092:581-1537(-)